MLALVRGRTGQTITMRSLDSYIRASKESAPKRLMERQKSRYAALDDAFKVEDHYERMIKETWRIFIANPTDAYLQITCIRELRQLQLILTDVKESIKLYGGMPHDWDLANIRPAEEDWKSEAIF